MPSQFFNIDNIPIDILACVYRLWYGDKYVIVKGKNLAGSVFLIQKGLAYFIAGGGKASEQSAAGVKGEGHKEGQGKNTFYFQFYTHVKTNPSLNWQVEVIIESDNGYQLLKGEQIELAAAIADKRCLNSNVEAYIPKFRAKSSMYGDWIKPAHVLCFKKFLKQPIRVSLNSR
jgi:hypothetical protein